MSVVAGFPSKLFPAFQAVVVRSTKFPNYRAQYSFLYNTHAFWPLACALHTARTLLLGASEPHHTLNAWILPARMLPRVYLCVRDAVAFRERHLARQAWSDAHTLCARRSKSKATAAFDVCRSLIHKKKRRNTPRHVYDGVLQSFLVGENDAFQLQPAEITILIN